jgi:NADH:ubiquinone oxidoreductase subunit F (NADH-binding)
MSANAPISKDESLALISLKHDTCECTEKCAPCRSVRAMAIAEIEKLTAERDQYKQIAALNAETIKEMQQHSPMAYRIVT